MRATIRLVMPGDFDALMSLARSAVEEVFPHLEFSEERTKELLQLTVTTGDPLGLVAEIDDEIVGFFAARIHAYAFATGLFVQDELFFVCPDKRGTRAAVKLLQEYIRWGAEDVGAKEIFLGTNSDFKPERTSALYQHLGAVRVGHNHRIVR